MGSRGSHQDPLDEKLAGLGVGVQREHVELVRRASLALAAEEIQAGA